MFATIRRLLSQFMTNSRIINNEPLNKVSLIVIILIDIFILINVFTGLDDISKWHISPNQAYPCYFEWQNYRRQTSQDKDYGIINLSLKSKRSYQNSQHQIYQQAEEGHIGKVSTTCLKYAEYKDKLKNSENQQIIKDIEGKQAKTTKLQQTNSNIRAQYDSTLLEKIAGQSREQSINQVGAEKAKQELEQNNRNIATFENEISNLKTSLIGKSESAGFINFLQDDAEFKMVEKGYQQASFWYPSIQLAFESVFLLPLIALSLSIHRFAQRRRYELISLMTWHLLVIFSIPLIVKFFEFLHIGAIFELIFNLISTLLGGLLFLVSYVYILVIPLIGFGIIKFFQNIVFNPKVQAIGRIQKSRCCKCAKKIRVNDTYCPYCGYYQYLQCENCQNLTYVKLPYCKNCGHFQNSNNS